MRPLPECDDTYCSCPNHIFTDTHVPCCPIHSAPLVQDDTPGYGRCVATTRRKPITGHVGGMRYAETGCTVFAPQSWVWLPRETFDPRDLPPANGWKPIELEDA